MLIYSHTLLYIESSILINICFHTLINIFTLTHISVTFSGSSLTSLAQPQCGPCDTPAKDPWTSPGLPHPAGSQDLLSRHTPFPNEIWGLIFLPHPTHSAPKYAPAVSNSVFHWVPLRTKIFSSSEPPRREKMFFHYTYASSLSAYPVNKESHAIWFLTRKGYNLPSTWESRHPLGMSINTFLRQRRTQNHCETDIGAANKTFSVQRACKYSRWAFQRRVRYSVWHVLFTPFFWVSCTRTQQFWKHSTAAPQLLVAVMF